MDLLQWWRDHKDELIPNGSIWGARRDQHWGRIKQTSLDAWTRSEKARSWIASHPNLAFSPMGVFGVLHLLRNQQDAAAATLAGAWFALARHFSQTKADRRRRITESYSKAVSQLASDKMEERLGGIYTLESISKESPSDYWTVIETLTAFVRERAKRKEPTEDIPWTMASFYESKKPTEAGGKRTDIAAVLSVITRRDESNYPREIEKNWSLDLSGADLVLANLSQANLSHANLSHADLSHADLDDADLTEANLNSANLSHTTLRSTNLTDAKLNGANLGHANLFYTNLTGAKLTDANLTDASLMFANLTDATLFKTNLTAATLSNANLTDASLVLANLTGANLTDANLTHAKLADAKLIDADLTGANLTDANLLGTNLSAADLADANLTGANLAQATLTHANLTGANLTGARLTHADLTEARGLRKFQLDKAHDENTKLPNGFRLRARPNAQDGNPSE